MTRERNTTRRAPAGSVSSLGNTFSRIGPGLLFAALAVGVGLSACVDDQDPEGNSGHGADGAAPTIPEVDLAAELVDACSFYRTYQINDESEAAITNPDLDRYQLTDTCRVKLWPAIASQVTILGIDPNDPADAPLVENIMRAFHTLLFRPTFTPPVNHCLGVGCESRPWLFEGPDESFPIAREIAENVSPVPATFRFDLTPDYVNTGLASWFHASVQVITKHTGGSNLASYDDGVLSLQQSNFGDPDRSALELAATLVHEAAHDAHSHHITDQKSDDCYAPHMPTAPGYTHDCTMSDSAYWVEHSYLQAAIIGGLVSKFPGPDPNGASYVERSHAKAGADLEGACQHAFQNNYEFQEKVQRAAVCTQASDHVLHPLFTTNTFWQTQCTITPYVSKNELDVDSGACCGTNDYGCAPPGA